MKMIELRTLTQVLCCLLLAGCGGNDTHEATCSEVGSRLCEMASSCGGGQTCLIATGADSGLTATFEHKSLADCRNFYALLGCSSSTFDFTGCDEVLATAQCAPTAKGTALELPEACK